MSLAHGSQSKARLVLTYDVMHDWLNCNVMHKHLGSAYLVVARMLSVACSHCVDRRLSGRENCCSHTELLQHLALFMELKPRDDTLPLYTTGQQYSSQIVEPIIACGFKQQCFVPCRQNAS